MEGLWPHHFVTLCLEDERQMKRRELIFHVKQLLSGCDPAEATQCGVVTASPKPPALDTFNQVAMSGGLMPHFHVILIIALKMETLASEHS
ncbi:Glycerophosphodiester Phosphodiesterase Domain-Containing Protein 4 [Manis pentadactyla]|nr:Glycerophosphodiester Phosphodiesterase Domain-Containing Protein 4 [Manis pentadactyla]